jgi:hypothetical protein
MIAMIRMVGAKDRDMSGAFLLHETTDVKWFAAGGDTDRRMGVSACRAIRITSILFLDAHDPLRRHAHPPIRLPCRPARLELGRNRCHAPITR